jgi:hypothetical protein
VTAVALLATCAQLGVTLTPEGADQIRVRGPRPARDGLLPSIRALKPELLKVLKRPALPGTGTTGTTTKAPTRRPLPPDGPGQAWAYNWRGVPVNLFGLRAGEDGRPPIFVSPKPAGLQ